MSNEIKLLKDNSGHPDFTDVDRVQEFFDFLTGTVPDGISFGRGHQPKMSENKAWSVIWYLQEHFSIIPDHIERCSVCDVVFDSWKSGHYSEKTGKHYCTGCDDGKD